MPGICLALEGKEQDTYRIHVGDMGQAVLQAIGTTISFRGSRLPTSMVQEVRQMKNRSV